MTPFWKLAAPPNDLAVIETATGLTLTYAQLAASADAQVATLQLPRSRGLIFLFCQNDFASLATYLGCIRAGHAITLLPANAATHAAAMLGSYRPDRLIAPSNLGPFPGYTAGDTTSAGLTIWRPILTSVEGNLHPSLALLLSTSGTTGSPKMVRLSHGNLQANAVSICEYLGISSTDRAPTTLPMSYSYGLSVVHSHLAAGATLLLGEFPVVQKETWSKLARHGANSFAGVPLLYQLLHRLRFDPRSRPTLRTYTQAGGRLDADTKRWFLDVSAGARFFVMYGQTEATARISYVPPDRVRDKLDSIGRPIPGGKLAIDPATRELVYRGPNVMLGYAETRADLAAGDKQHGVLRTGDLGREDADGFFYVDGRLKRFLKLAGLRVGLDELERHLESQLDCAVACGGSDEALLVHVETAVSAAQIQTVLQESFGIAPALVTVRTGTPLTRLPNGKIDYAALVHAKA